MDSANRHELLPAEIGARARMIRKRRGLSQAVTAGLAGISKGYLSMLETGQRRSFTASVYASAVSSSSLTPSLPSTWRTT